VLTRERYRIPTRSRQRPKRSRCRRRDCQAFIRGRDSSLHFSGYVQHGVTQSANVDRAGCTSMPAVLRQKTGCPLRLVMMPIRLAWLEAAFGAAPCAWCCVVLTFGTASQRVADGCSSCPTLSSAHLEIAQSAERAPLTGRCAAGLSWSNGPSGNEFLAGWNCTSRRTMFVIGGGVSRITEVRRYLQASGQDRSGTVVKKRALWGGMGGGLIPVSPRA